MATEKKFSKRHCMLCLIVSAIALSGCVSATSKKMTANFGDAANTLVGKTEKTLTRARSADSDFAVSTVLLDNNIGVASGLVTPEISLDDIALRVSLLEEIKKYANALVVMASDEQPERIDKASRELYSSIGSLNQTIQSSTGRSTAPISNENIRLIAVATNVAGRWFFENERLKALNQVVGTAVPVINDAVDILMKEIKKDGLWSKTLQISLESHAKNLYKLAQSTSNLKQKTEFLTKSLIVFEQSKVANEIFDRLNSSLRKMKDSHMALANALDEDSEMNTKIALGKISMLESEISRIYTFQASLSESKEK